MYIIAKINGKLTAINGESPKPQRGETTQRRLKPYGHGATTQCKPQRGDITQF